MVESHGIVCRRPRQIGRRVLVMVIGGEYFCELRDGGDHMGERMALGFALAAVGPSGILPLADTPGTAKWARIWAGRRGVPVMATMTRPDAVVAFDGASVSVIERAEAADVPVYRATLRAKK